MILEQTKGLIRAWIADSHGALGKPFYLGEFNAKNVDRMIRWREIYHEFEAADGDGSSF